MEATLLQQFFVEVVTVIMTLSQSVAQSQIPASETSHPAPTQAIVIPLIPTKEDKVVSLLEDQDVLPAQRQMIDEILTLLPSTCLDRLESFYVRYDQMEYRGLAGKDAVIISGNVPNDEFRALLIHEVWGHVIDLGCLRGTKEAGESKFRDGDDEIYADDPSVLFYQISWEDENTRKDTAKRQDFVSGYAFESDVFEDLAESVTFYFFHQNTMRELALNNEVIAQKLAWLETYVFADINPPVQSTYTAKRNEIPWDATKLPYRWLASADIAQVQ